jgi:Zinc finger, C2H2 type
MVRSNQHHSQAPVSSRFLLGRRSGPAASLPVMSCMLPLHPPTFKPRTRSTKSIHALAQVELRSPRQALHKTLAILVKTAGIFPSTLDHQQDHQTTTKWKAREIGDASLLKIKNDISFLCNDRLAVHIPDSKSRGPTNLQVKLCIPATPRTSESENIAKCKVQFLLHDAETGSKAVAFGSTERLGSPISSGESAGGGEFSQQNSTNHNMSMFVERSTSMSWAGGPSSTKSTAASRPTVHRCPHVGCGKILCRKSYLVDHMRLHDGTRPFVCEVPGCGVGFRWRTNLARHIKTLHRETASADFGLDS